MPVALRQAFNESEIEVLSTTLRLPGPRRAPLSDTLAAVAAPLALAG